MSGLATIRGMEPNPYEAPKEVGVDDRARNERPPRQSFMRGCLSLVFLVAVLFSSLASLVARIESLEELFGFFVHDILIGFAIVGIAALNVPRLFRLPVLTRGLAIIALAIFCSGSLIAWHSFQVYVRSHIGPR